MQIVLTLTMLVQTSLLAKHFAKSLQISRDPFSWQSHEPFRYKKPLIYSYGHFRMLLILMLEDIKLDSKITVQNVYFIYVLGLDVNSN